MKEKPTIGEAIRLLSSMLVIAEKQKDQGAVTRYAGKIGDLLNQIIMESQSWPSHAKK